MLFFYKKTEKELNNNLLKKSVVFLKTYIHLFICILLSNIVLSTIYFALLKEANRMSGHPDFFYVINNLRSILSGIFLPLPTLPILAIIAFFTIVSTPSFYCERRAREIYIRLLCGATRKDVYNILLIDYFKLVILSTIPCVISAIVIEVKVSVCVIVLLSLFLLNLLIAFIYFVYHTIRGLRGWKLNE